jgi:hypothetical protein
MLKVRQEETNSKLRQATSDEALLMRVQGAFQRSRGSYRNNYGRSGGYSANPTPTPYGHPPQSSGALHNFGGTNHMIGQRGLLGQNPSSAVICNHCGQPNHIARFCPAPAPMQTQSRNFAPSTGRRFGANAIEDVAPIYSSEPLSPNPFNIDPSDEDLDQALAALSVSESLDDAHWFFDSGASRHFSRNPDVFSNLQLAHSSNSVTFAGGQSHVIAGHGTVDVKSPSGDVQYITDVQYVLSLYKNLLSIGQLADRNCMVVFTSNRCTVLTKQKPHQVLASGTRDPSNGLYRLDTVASKATVRDLLAYLAQLPTKPTQNSFPMIAADSATTSTDLTHLWHCRLGHLNYPQLSDLSSKQLATGIPRLEINKKTCSICVQAKHPRTPTPITATHRATRPLELIHTDLCGPLSITSLGGSNYFITFTDDYSRRSWIYFIRTKNQALSKFIDFHKMMTNQLHSHRILTLRSDRGSEYLASKFSDYLKAAGITRQLTTAHTPH